MERTFTTPTPPTVQIRIPTGSITVEQGSDGTTTVWVSDDRSDSIIIDERNGPQGQIIAIETPSRRKLGFVFERSVGRVKVTCPAGTSLVVRTASGSVDALLPLGDVRIETASGDVRIGDVAGSLVAKTASGDIRARRVSGRAEVHTVSGDIELGSVEDGVVAKTASGDVELADVATGDANVRCVSGDVSVGVRRGSRVAVNASSVSGSLRSDLDLSGSPVAGDGPMVELDITTVSGDVHIRRSQSVPH
jgi:DUF4097 and DUF4098 domain-containing protein YvlB